MLKRKIKFRGKGRDSEEWIYGDLVQRPQTLLSIKTLYGGEKFVYCDSVGQYTGLKDKNGKEIYEGDILTWGEDGFAVPSPIVVEYKHGAFGYVYVDGNFYPFAGVSSFTFNLFDTDDRFEVIGNIYDNPELLKGGNNEN